MKFTLGLPVFAALLIAGPSVSNAAVTDTIKVTSMQCGMCESRIEKSLKKSEFISDATADVESETVIVTYDERKLDKAGVEKLISMVGYDTEHLAADKAAQDALHGCCKPGAHKKTAPTKTIQKASPSK